ncbi:MAG: DNA alkylation repair protein [Saprospiraceae bacterium]|nr:DNA alkylation repair protein [Saprospiraceae bacterium]
MKSLTRKGEVAEAVNRCIDVYSRQGLDACISETNEQLLNVKIKFPLFEFAGFQFFEKINFREHILFCQKIAELKTIGGNVLIGIILQNRLPDHLPECYEKAAEYIIIGDEWYVCDIIGERVFGYSLLTQADKSLPWYHQFSTHENKWVVRALGAGGHYAIKKGLDKNSARQLFQLLLSLANVRDQQVRQGIGWAAKTTAKFHPDIIATFKAEIADETKVANWFRRKVDIGLSRNKYAQGN